MEKSKVFFTDLRTTPKMNLLDKLEKLLERTGIKNIDFKDKLTAIKIHFGEPGNLAYIRPNYASKLVHIVKKLGGKPFLTDANTLYSGRRSNCVDHLESAYENGFNPLATGCHVIIADGLKGVDYREIKIDQELCKTAKIGSAIAESDILISMTHFKGHEMTGFGGTLKNLGMGCASVGGKLEQHSTSKPNIKTEKCISCGQCLKNCAHDAIVWDENKKAKIVTDNCVGCGQCIVVCPAGAVRVLWEAASELLNKKIAEYTYAAIKGKQCLHISFIMNVSPDCDCWNSNDVPLVPDIGIAASFDPVALDMACVDLVNGAPIIYGSKLTDSHHEHGELIGEDKFSYVHPNTDWRIGLKHAEKIGVGSMEYELIKI